MDDSLARRVHPARRESWHRLRRERRDGTDPRRRSILAASRARARIPGTHEARRRSPRHSAEQDADAAAASWLLGGLDDGAAFTKRALGIATAFAAMTSLGIHFEEYDGVTHPRHFDRLVHALAPYIQVDHHKTWQFIVTALKLHIDTVAQRLPDVVHESSTHCLEVDLDLLAEDAEAIAAERAG